MAIAATHTTAFATLEPRLRTASSNPRDPNTPHDRRYEHELPQQQHADESDEEQRHGEQDPPGPRSTRHRRTVDSIISLIWISI